MKKILKIIILIVFILSLVINTFFVGIILSKSDLKFNDRIWMDKEKYESLIALEKPAQLYSAIKEKFYLEVSEDEVEQSIIKSLFDSLGDKYSYYMTKEEFEKNYKNTKGELVGIGIIIEITSEGKLLIKEVKKDSPADLAGFIPGDLIIAVNSTALNTENTSSVIGMISSAEKKYGFFGKYKEVKINYLRNGIENSVMVSPILIEDPEFEYKTIEDIGYIKIKRFIEDTPTYFSNALKEFNNKNITKLIIDLRDNPGGLLDSLVQSAGYIIGDELILTTNGKYYGEKEFFSKNDKIFQGEIVILINENSASASEAFSAAVKDYGVGTLIGETTFGKGIVQNTFKLKDGSGYKLTTSEYFSPKGNVIHNKGVTPDIISKEPLEEAINFLSK